VRGLPWQRTAPAVVQVACKASVPTQSMLHPQPLLSADIAMWVALHAAMVDFSSYHAIQTADGVQAVRHQCKSLITATVRNDTTTLIKVLRMFMTTTGTIAVTTTNKSRSSG